MLISYILTEGVGRVCNYLTTNKLQIYIFLKKRVFGGYFS